MIEYILLPQISHPYLLSLEVNSLLCFLYDRESDLYYNYTHYIPYNVGVQVFVLSVILQFDESYYMLLELYFLLLIINSYFIIFIFL